jgi:hypothetical protein
MSLPLVDSQDHHLSQSFTREHLKKALNQKPPFLMFQHNLEQGATVPPLEKPVIMPTNVGPAGIAPLRVPRNQAPNAAYHELFTMNMRTRKSNGWESNQRMIDMAMAGMPR